MRIGLNLLHARPEIGGVWNYVSNLVAAVGREDTETEYVAFVTEVSAALVTPRPNFRNVIVPLRSRLRTTRVLFENTALQLLVWRERLDCLHWFANTIGLVDVVPAVVTVYDLQPFLSYPTMSRAKRVFLRSQMRAAVRRAAMLLPMSQATGQELRDRLGADPRRMLVVPPILESMFQPPEPTAVSRFRQQYGLPAEFWLYVAHGWPHKNHERLLHAYRELRAENPSAWPLVLRGDPQPGFPTLAELSARAGLKESVIVLPRLKREELPLLYASAAALVFPSLYEGGGIPVLEAQACGCPLVASDIPAIREFAGEAGHYMNPQSVDDIKRAMIATAADVAARERLLRLGLERVRTFRSISVVDRLVAAYRSACSARSHHVQ